MNARSPRFDDLALLDERDRASLLGRSPPHWLPEAGLLIRALCGLAFEMQKSGLRGESSQVRVNEAEALAMMVDPRAMDVLRAATQLGVLDEAAFLGGDALFAHQLMQEYFAARTLSRQFESALLRTEWRDGQITPTYDEVIRDRARLPNAPSTGWEETAQMAAAMAGDKHAFVRALAVENLPVAGLCAAASDVADAIRPETKRQLQDALLARMRDRQADIRARIATGEALGELGDPRFERRAGPHGAYLIPPLIPVAADDYRLGSAHFTSASSRSPTPNTSASWTRRAMSRRRGGRATKRKRGCAATRAPWNRCDRTISVPYWA